MAGQLPRPWSFRLGSMTRPTTAPVTDQPRPVPARIIRPPIIRPAVVTEPEPTTPKESAKSPPQLPRPAASLTPPLKKEPSPPPPPSPPPAALSRLNHVPSPPATASTRPVVPPPVTVLITRPVVPLSSATAALTRPVVPSPEKPGSSPKGRSSIAGSPTKNDEAFDKGSSAKQGSPVPSPSIPKSIPAVPSPYMSPKPKVAASPPSPLVLPPPQLKSNAVLNHESIPQEVERKTVVFQKVIEKPPTTNQEQNGKLHETNKLHNENQGKVKGINGARKGLVRTDVERDSNTRVITMAGENRGASMEVVMSDKNNNNARHLQIRQSKNNNVHETENEDNKSKKKSIGSHNNGALPMKGFFNSNVQGINNSILMDSKFAHHDPGIHLRFSRIPSPDKEADEEHH